MWDAETSMWIVTNSVWTVADSMWAFAASTYAVTASMWAIAASVWNLEASVWTVTLPDYTPVKYEKNKKVEMSGVICKIITPLGIFLPRPDYPGAIRLDEIKNGFIIFYGQ